MIGARVHTHGKSWNSTADWLELRHHLINVHGETPDEIDRLTLEPKATLARRMKAETRHQAHHSHPTRRAREWALSGSPGGKP